MNRQSQGQYRAWMQDDTEKVNEKEESTAAAFPFGLVAVWMRLFMGLINSTGQPPGTERRPGA